MKKLRLHWTLHPEKDEAWYSTQKERMTEDEIARELDISYDLSASGTVFGKEFSYETHCFEQAYEPNKHLSIIRSFDYGRVNATLFGQLTQHGNLIVFRELVLEQSGTHDQGKQVQLISNEYRCNGFKDYGDPAGGYKDARTYNSSDDALTTDEEILARYGSHPTSYRIQGLKDRRKNGIELMKLKLNEMANKRPVIQIYAPGCPLLVEAFQSGYRYKVDRDNKVVHSDAIHEEHPYEDVMDCLRYMVIESFQVEERRKTVKKPSRPKPRNKYTGY